MARLRIGISALLLVTTFACSESLEPLPFVVSLDASRTTAARGDTITFVVGAQGGQLIGVQIDFGDGATDQYATSGARTARVSFKHAYGAAGAYTARAVVTEVTGQKDATVNVTIN